MNSVKLGDMTSRQLTEWLREINFPTVKKELEGLSGADVLEQQSALTREDLKLSKFQFTAFMKRLGVAAEDGHLFSSFVTPPPRQTSTYQSPSGTDTDDTTRSCSIGPSPSPSPDKKSFDSEDAAHEAFQGFIKKHNDTYGSNEEGDTHLGVSTGKYRCSCATCGDKLVTSVTFPNPFEPWTRHVLYSKSHRKHYENMHGDCPYKEQSQTPSAAAVVTPEHTMNLVEDALHESGTADNFSVVSSPGEGVRACCVKCNRRIKWPKNGKNNFVLNVEAHVKACKERKTSRRRKKKTVRHISSRELSRDRSRSPITDLSRSRSRDRGRSRSRDSRRSRSRERHTRRSRSWDKRRSSKDRGSISTMRVPDRSRSSSPSRSRGGFSTERTHVSEHDVSTG